MKATIVAPGTLPPGGKPPLVDPRQVQGAQNGAFAVYKADGRSPVGESFDEGIGAIDRVHVPPQAVRSVFVEPSFFSHNRDTRKGGCEPFGDHLLRFYVCAGHGRPVFFVTDHDVTERSQRQTAGGLQNSLQGARFVDGWTA